MKTAIAHYYINDNRNNTVHDLLLYNFEIKIIRAFVIISFLVIFFYNFYSM